MRKSKTVKNRRNKQIKNSKKPPAALKANTKQTFAKLPKVRLEAGRRSKIFGFTTR